MCAELGGSMKKIADTGGVEVYYIPSRKFKTASINITFCDNLRRERAYRNALLPSVLCRGTEQYPTSREISAKLQRLYGANLSTNIDKKGELQLIQFVGDFVDERYARQTPHLEEDFFRLLLDVITDPLTENGRFLDSYVEQEKQNNDDFIRSAINDKQSYAVFRGQEVMCSDEPYGISELGALGDGAEINSQSLYEYYRTYFLKKLPIKIFYCGREEPQRLLALLKERAVLFGEERIALETGYRERQCDSLRLVTERYDVTQGKLTIGFRTNVKPDSPQFYPLAVCNGIFGAGVQSKLFQVVREKYSLAYYAASRLDRLKGILTAYSGIELEKKEQAQQLILEQMEEIKRGNISQEEFRSTIQMFCNSYRSYKDTQFAIMDFFIGQSFLPESKTIDEFLDAIQQVTREEVIQVAQRIVPDTVYFLAGPEESSSIDGFAQDEAYGKQMV